MAKFNDKASCVVDAPVFTIDGPSGAGKGTVSRALAKRLGWHYLDSGAIYRALAIAVLNAQIQLDDEASIVNVAKSMVLRFESDETLKVWLNDEDITALIQTETCGNAASKIAAFGLVRKALFQKQREFQQVPGLVADGRDMGTVVFEDAAYKVFLTASSDERAQRRYKQLIEKGCDVTLLGLKKEIEERDKRDSERSEAPLKAAADAVYIDSSDLSIEQVIERCLSLIK